MVYAAAATSWTGWAVSSITSKFYKSGGGGEVNKPVSTGDSGARGDKVESGSRVRVGEGEGREERSRSKIEEGWDEDEWEVRVYYCCVYCSIYPQDFNISGEQSRDTGGVSEGGTGMGLDKEGGTEEWEDDGWGTFEPLEETQDVPSSGADFFDTIEQPRKTEEQEDLFERLGVGVAGGGVAKKKPSPPPVSSSLFGGGRGSVGDGREEEGGDWGDWGGDFSTKKVLHARH